VHVVHIPKNHLMLIAGLVWCAAGEDDHADDADGARQERPDLPGRPIPVPIPALTASAHAH
jgi:hypothetical protein